MEVGKLGFSLSLRYHARYYDPFPTSVSPVPPGGGQIWRTYYYAGGQRIAMRERTTTTDVLIYLHGDHLGSVSLATDASGGVVSEMRYYPYGETRSGTLPTDYQFTGQRFEADLGLYDYNARYYDPLIGRFISADTIVPSPGDPQSLNRYAYVRNNPLKYTDPSGHRWVSSGPDDIIDERTIGSQYGGPYEPLFTPSEQNAMADQAFATVMDFAPGVGDAKGFIEAFTGSDLVTGESLGNWRYLGLLGISELRHLDEFSDLARALPAPQSLKALLAPVTEFANEGVIILTRADFEKFGEEWGRHSGQVFVLTSRDADLMRNAPDIAEVGRRLGKEFPAGSELLRVDISDLSSHNVRVPTEHFDERFIPGGWTSGGVAERVIDGPINLYHYSRGKLTYGR